MISLLSALSSSARLLWPGICNREWWVGAKELVVEKGAIPFLLELLRKDNEPVQMMAYRVLTNIGENDNNQNKIVDAGGLKLLIEYLLKNEDESITTEALSALSVLLENKHHTLRFVEEGGLKALMPLVSDTEPDVAQSASNLLHHLATQDDIRTWFLAEGLVEKLLRLLSAKEDAISKNSIKILAQLVLNDAVAHSVIQEMSLVMEMLKSEDAEVQLHAAMIIGNVGRTDESCLKLVEAGAPQLLSNLLTKDPRLQQLAAGALRNLSIPMQNKAKVGESGVFPGLIACLSSTSAHAMFAAIGAVKALLTLRANRKKFLELNGLEAVIRIKDAIIIDASQQEDPSKPKDLRIQYEAARTLAILAGEESAVDDIVRLSGIGLLRFLVDSPFEVLHVECLKALQNLIKKEENRAQLVEDGLADTVITALSRANGDDLVLGWIGLLSILAENDAFREQLVAKHLDTALAAMEVGSPEQAKASQALRAKLGSC